ncbi:amino acid efflux transporter [Nocardioides luteus]|uniref:Amino acid permease n=1 Tax=Nocardioides luteus TaxID=1844 RepID=A0ABQ5SSN6_9ACTN|nr:amino acid permease [Nocardioides luteus]MDR7311129.1 amino acid efflux transporter [Nocardioides luteus]GGR62476.1 amino acid permease [Nocardioides luteus]GLJ66675.1 amino acid permease [Nocardioides luteus]
MKNDGLSVPQGAALTLGAVLGTGVISLPALAADEAGPASLVAWLALILLSVPLAATFAALGARHPDGGGVATYARLAFNQHVSTMVGWAFYLTIGVGAPVAAGFGGAYVADAFGGGRDVSMAATAAIILLVTAMNWFGIKVSGGVQLAIAGTIALLLLVAVLVALPHAEIGRLTPFAPHGWGSVGTAAAILVWAFAGWEILSSLSADYRDPARDIRRATVIAMVVVTVLYLGVAFATVAALGPTSGAAPLADLLVLGFGEPARPVTAVVAVLLTVGAINAYFAGGSRLGAALAREGGLPRALADPASAIPRRSLLAVAAVALVTLAVVWVAGASTDAALLMASGTFSLLYVVGAAAALRLLPRGGRSWWAAVCSLVAALVLLGLTGAHLLGPVLFAGAGLAWSLLRSRPSSGPAREPGQELEPAREGLCPDGSVA